MKRIPAKEKGLEYWRPILIKANALDHKRQANIARKGVDRKNDFFLLIMDCANAIFETNMNKSD